MSEEFLITIGDAEEHYSTPDYKVFVSRDDLKAILKKYKLKDGYTFEQVFPEFDTVEKIFIDDTWLADKLTYYTLSDDDSEGDGGDDGDTIVIAQEILERLAKLEIKVYNDLEPRVESLEDRVDDVIDEEGNIKANVITAEQILAGSITADKIRAESVLASHIKSDSILTRHLQAESITASKIASDQITAGHIKADAIESKHIKSNVIETKHLQANSITSDKIGANQIVSTHILANSIQTQHIGADQIVAGHIQSESITSDKIQAGSITADRLASGTITADKIQTGTITAGSGIIAEGAIGDAQISKLSASKISAGILDTAYISLRSSNDATMSIAGNQILINDTSNIYEPFNRVILGQYNDTEGNLQYGLLVRDADGETVMIDGQGVHNAGITDGAITDAKVDADANIDGSKLNIETVVSNINDNEYTIQGSKIYVDNTTLDVAFDTQKGEIKNNTELITTEVSKINATSNKIQLSVDSMTTKIENLEGAVPYVVEIVSSNGNVFKNGNVSTTLTAKIREGNNDVSARILDSQIKWSRTSTDTLADAIWNEVHADAGKTIEITTEDVIQKATFRVDVYDLVDDKLILVV